MIIVRYILTALGLNLKLSDHIIEAENGTFKGSTALMVDLGPYESKYLNTGKITPEESFMNAQLIKLLQKPKSCSMKHFAPEKNIQ